MGCWDVEPRFASSVTGLHRSAEVCWNLCVVPGSGPFTTDRSRLDGNFTLDSGTKALKSFERQIDEKVAALPVLLLPIRPVLTAFHVFLHGLLHGGGGTPPKVQAGYSLAGRLGHLSALLARCPAEPIGANAVDAFGAYRELDPDLSQTRLLLGYSHFCDLMPEVHRGYFAVAGDADKGFQLSHASAEFAASEARDILLSELALSTLAAPPPVDRGAIQRLAAMAPRLDLEELSRVLGAYAHHFNTTVLEEPVIGDEGLGQAIGVNLSAFGRFRAVLMAISQFAIDMSGALRARVDRTTNDKAAIESEWLEWVSVHWTEDFVCHLVRGLVGIDEATMDRLLSVFSLDFRSSPITIRHAGDGFFPPLARLRGGGLLIGPDLTQLYLQTRNVVYAIQRIDRRLFDDLISGHLEPELIKSAERQISLVPTLEMRRSVQWANGEIDLLVLDSGRNCAMQVQAKASLPPHGARMVDRLESRLKEGIEQLERFRSQGQGGIDDVVGRAFGRHLSKVVLVDALLARACFGTNEVWARGGTSALLSLPLLAGVIHDEMAGKKSLDLGAMPSLAAAFLDRVVEGAKPRWAAQELDLDGTRVSVPMLEYDQAFVHKERLRIATIRSGTGSGGRRPGPT